MFRQIKKELLQNPQSIINILEEFGFSDLRIHNNEIRCGLSDGHNTTAIRIRLINNDNLFVNDFVRGLSYDLINYIVKVKSVDFVNVMKAIKSELGISDFYELDTKRSVFGGFYDKIKRRDNDLYVKIYPDEILGEYKNVYSSMFLRDNISFYSQDRFEIGYDIVSQRITIPIRNEYGDLIGVKGRANWKISEEDPKYLYLVPCASSQTLYGYCQNYQYFINNDILVFEAEKSVMQCCSYGINNCVSLSGNSISTKQCRLLMTAVPKRVIFMLDKGLDTDITRRNAKMLSVYTQMSDTKILWWDWTKSVLPDKSSPSDYGRETLLNILNYEVAEVSL